MNDPIAFSSPAVSSASAPVAAETPVSALDSAANSAAEPAARKTRWPLYLLGGTLALGVAALGATWGAYATWRAGDLIAPGVSVAGVEIGGFSKADARARIARHFGEFPLQLQTGSSGFEANLAELGGAPSLDFVVAKAAKIGRQGDAIAGFWRVFNPQQGERLMLPVVWNKSALVSRLREWNADYAARPVDARLVVDAGGARVVPERLGRALNLGATAQAIQKRYFVGTRALKAYTRSVAPALGAADMGGQNVLLASYPTRFNRGLIGRSENIRVACLAIEGHVLMPGDDFSFNALTGERTWKKGYRMAHIFETKPGAKQAEVVDGLAGGVCQVSSTLFNAVRRANDEIGARGLRIVERNSHSLPVNYVPPGLDATVAWPSKDFRFRNTLPHPVWLRTSIRRGKLTIGVWGRVPGGGAQLAALPNQRID